MLTTLSVAGSRLLYIADPSYHYLKKSQMRSYLFTMFQRITLQVITIPHDPPTIIRLYGIDLRI